MLLATSLPHTYTVDTVTFTPRRCFIIEYMPQMAGAEFANNFGFNSIAVLSFSNYKSDMAFIFTCIKTPKIV